MKNSILNNQKSICKKSSLMIPLRYKTLTVKYYVCFFPVEATYQSYTINVHVHTFVAIVPNRLKALEM